MSVTSLGDLAQSFMLRRQNLQVRQEVNRLTEELTTGRSADLSARLSGDYAYLSDIERSLGLIQGYRTSVAEAGVFTGAMQTALERVQTVSGSLSRSIIDGLGGGLPAVQAIGTQAATDAFEQIVASLNTQAAGRSLFAGNATDRPAVAAAEVLLSELRATIASQTSVEGVRVAVDQWFESPSGGFETLGYTGSNDGLAPYRLDRQGTVDLDLRGNSPALKEVLKQVSLAVLAGDTGLPLTDLQRTDLLRSAGEGLLGAQDRLTSLRADLGFAEARIEEGRVRLASEKTSLELAQNALLSVDPFDSATQLENAQSQLESLYAVTVRLSRLSLSEFMR
jgi:flagellar hook-associated protein 3 FlgL